jgi:hypothetical protein
MTLKNFAVWASTCCFALVCVLSVLWISQEFYWRPYDGRSFPVPMRVQELLFLAVSGVASTLLFRVLGGNDDSAHQRVIWRAVMFAVVAFVLFDLPRL